MTDSEHRTSEIVREAIEEDAVVRQGLERGLINARALARHIQATSKTGASLESIVSAIWRYPVKKPTASSHGVGELIAKLSMRDGIFALGASNSPELWRALTSLQEHIDVSRGDTMRIISGLESTTVVIDMKNADLLRGMVPERSVGRVYENLAELAVQLKEPSWETTGVLSALSTQLSMNRVNIFFHFGYGPPPVIVFEVHEKDAVTAYRALERLKKSAGGG